ATPNGTTSFGFTGSPSPLTTFSLVDDGTLANTKVFSNITNFQTYTVNESSIPSGWDFNSVACSVTTPNGGSYTTSTTMVTINLNEGENWTCTYNNSKTSLTIIKDIVNDNGGTATVSAFGITTSAGSLVFDAGSVNGSTTTYTATALSHLT